MGKNKVVLQQLDQFDHVRRRTADPINARIDAEIYARVKIYAKERDAEAISIRLAELEREWDIERTLETQAAITALLSLVLGIKVNKKWFWLAGINQFFLLQHAIWGWCPPIELQRRLGIRTRREINAERVALQALRGDFDTVAEKSQPAGQTRAALTAATKV